MVTTKHLVIDPTEFSHRLDITDDVPDLPSLDLGG